MKVGYVAFTTVTVLGVATGASALAAASAVTTAATVAYAALSVLGAAFSLASVSAYFDPKSLDASSYFENMKKHAAHTLPGFITLIAQSLVGAVIDGVAKGVSDRIYAKIFGQAEKRQTA